MQIPFKRPIVFLDFETTGTNRESDRIIEYCFIKLFPNGERMTIKGLLNPGIPIPPETTAIHGLDDSHVFNAPAFRDKANSFLEFIQGCDVAGYGSNQFDIPLLYNELQRCQLNWDYSNTLFVDVCNIFKVHQPRDLTAALSFYCGRDHEEAHSAEADVMATIDVFLSQCQEEDMPATIEEIALYSNYGKKVLDLSGKFTYNDKGEVVFNFGPHRGQPAADHLDFVFWMQSKDFASDTLKVCNGIIQGIYSIKGDPVS